MTKKQQLQFVEFYRWLYGDTSKETGTGELPSIFNGDVELHRNMWKLQLMKIIGKTKYNKVYYIRPGSKTTYGEHLFNWLRLGYGPKVLDYDTTINEKKLNTN